MGIKGFKTVLCLLGWNNKWSNGPAKTNRMFFIMDIPKEQNKAFYWNIDREKGGKKWFLLSKQQPMG